MKRLITLLIALVLIVFTANYYRGEMFKLAKLSSEELLTLFPNKQVSIDFSLVRPIPKWWGLVPFLHSNIASSLAPISSFIFVPPEMFDDLQSDSPAPENIAVLMHELAHHAHLQDLSWLEASQYLFSRRYRIHEELGAISIEMHYLQQQNIGYDIQRKSAQLSGPTYLWAGSVTSSKQVLQKLWQEINLSSE